jgi:hypothetical protein
MKGRGCKCWNEVVGVSPITLVRAFFLRRLLKPISGEPVKEEYPPINRVFAKKSAASCQDLHIEGSMLINDHPAAHIRSSIPNP